MDWITNRLAIGGLEEAPQVREAGIQVVDISAWPSGPWKPDLLESGMEELRTKLSQGRVFCHCGAGIDRAPTLVMAYLVHVTGMSPSEATSFIQASRPAARPHVDWVEALLPPAPEEAPPDVGEPPSLEPWDPTALTDPQKVLLRLLKHGAAHTVSQLHGATTFSEQAIKEDLVRLQDAGLLVYHSDQWWSTLKSHQHDV